MPYQFERRGLAAARRTLQFACRLLMIVLAIVFSFKAIAANAQPAQTANAQDDVLRFFYKDPRPERLIGFLEQYEARAPNWNAYPWIAGAFAVIFRRHPDQIERLIPVRFNATTAETVVAALQLSGNRSRVTKLLPKLREAGRDTQLAAEFSALPERLEDLQIKTATHLDILWGAAFASGDPRYVEMILTFFAQIANRSEPIAIDVARVTMSMIGGPKVTDLRSKYDNSTGTQIVFAAAALWALQSNAKQDVFVEQVLLTYTRDHPGVPATKAILALSPKLKRTDTSPRHENHRTSTLADPAVVDDLVNNPQNKKVAKV